MSSNIIKSVSRYVVPFYFEYEKNGYEKIKKHFAENSAICAEFNESLGLPKDGKWLAKGFWENYKSDKDTQAEMELYSYLPSVFAEDEKAGKKDVSNLGCSFVFKSNGSLAQLEYRYKKDKTVTFEIKDLGILLFRNGTGFIWYESGFGKKEPSIEDYVAFQNSFKELARSYEDIEKEKFVKKTGYDNEKHEGIYDHFRLGEWLSNILSADSLGIRFWAEKENHDKLRIPDKALLFQYLFVDPMSDSDKNDLIFRITNGYDEKYNSPDDIDENLYKPFGNVCYYITKAGMGCVVTDSGTNTDFFKGQFSEKYIRDYFFIFMLLSYQTYSCAHYSRLLTKLPAEERTFIKNTVNIDKLEALSGQINLFMVKSVFDSVSNMHQQNGVYRYGKATLCIEEDIQSITVGLDALKEMEKEKRDQKVDSALVIFGFMVVISTVIDALNLVDWVMDPGRIVDWKHLVILSFIIFLTLYLIVTLWINRRKK